MTTLAPQESCQSPPKCCCFISALLCTAQVLSANIFALVRHAAHPTNLLGLRQLHVDMVGSLEGSCIDPGGLPQLPLLTQLVFFIDTKVGWAAAFVVPSICCNVAFPYSWCSL
jgi:hypothetical protein